MKNLVIVESPTKAKTISKFLGKDYTIKFSMGHIMDLPKSTLGIDLENNFDPQLEVVADKKSILAELKKAAKEADEILLATDPDREGEAIASNIKSLLEGDKRAKRDTGDKSEETSGPSVPSVPSSASRFKRIVFHEITEDAIKEAVENPRAVDNNLVGAQIARRVLDRLVGYQLSPMLWKKVRRGLSAGRVQSVALRLLVEREREIEKFGKEPYFTVHGMFQKETEGTQGTKETKATEFELVEIKEEKIEVTQKLVLYDGEYTFSKTTVDTKEKADSLLSDAKKHAYVISSVATREAKRSPNPPFTTSTLQQAAANRLGLPGKRTMSVAQKLYEEGYITYHKTDSVTLSPVAVKQMRDYITKEYGDKYIPSAPRSYFTKQKNAQEAHEAIRPTKVGVLAAGVKAELGEAYAKLYDLIWKRAVASQMTDAQIESTTVLAESISENSDHSEIQKIRISDSQTVRKSDSLSIPSFPEYRFKTTGSVLLFDGFLKLTPQALEDRKLPKFVNGEKVELTDIRAEEHETTAPPRYNDASLIKTLEEKSIGRPSTYASIIGTITDRGYVERVERRFVPTAVGMAVNDFLVTNFSTIDDIPFTAQMEDDLDAISNGEKEWHKMMKEFYDPFAKKLKEVEGAARVAIPVEQTGEKCPQCHQGNLIIRTGRFGKFFSCDRFPECRFTKQFVEDTNLWCPKCGPKDGGSPREASAKADAKWGKVIVKKTKKGRKFFGCSNYPACDFAAWKLEDIKKSSSPKS